MEAVTLLLFCTALVLCVILNISIIYALITGLLIFCIYGRLKGYQWISIAKMVLSGIKAAKNILIVFILIGMLTALWRACGTIPMMICYAARLISPKTLILMTFLLNCGVSVLTGTAFGAAATMGVICMTMAVSMQINPVFAGGAMLSGVFFGDRCSPVSTSALLVSELTGTNIFNNIKRMLYTALLPFLLTCAVYAVLGFFSGSAGYSIDLLSLFGGEFNLHWSASLPAIAILALSALKINVKITMSVSIAAAVLICLFIQRMEAVDIIRLITMGYSAKNQEVAAMLNGGGVFSMLRVMAIVCISSAYAGVFRQTGLLNHIKEMIVKLSDKITPYGGMLFTAIIAAMIACNQTLTIMLTHQVCNDLEPDPQKLAINLEDTAVIVAPLVPWSIACAVPLASAGAPAGSLLAACFIFLLPVCRLINSLTGVTLDPRPLRGSRK